MVNTNLPPGDPVILDEDGKQLQGLVGPYNEGDPLTLTCQVEVGKPRPAVTWWKDYAQLDESYFFSPDGSLVKNKLEVAAITRNDLLATFTCQAANNNITIPASVSITLDLNLKPLDVTIQPPERPLSANKEVELVCSSSGSRPPATLTWWKGGQQIRSARDSEDANGGAGGGGGLSASTSVLLFTPTVDDNNRILSCRAENKAIPGSALEEGWKLEVYYTPMVTLQLGGKLKDSEIQEGRDVYLDCKIVANPYTTDVSWLFEGRELPANASAGIIVSTQSLVLQRVQRAQRGRYACAATNKEGRGVSNDLYLRVKYAPVCKTHQKWVYGASKQETVSVRCELDADPTETTFRWVFNSSSSGRRRDLASQDASSSGSRSTLAFVVHSDDDYGTLLCWGTNSVGIQRDPCAFSIVPAALLTNSEPSLLVLAKAAAEQSDKRRDVRTAGYKVTVRNTKRPNSEQALFSACATAGAVYLQDLNPPFSPVRRLAASPPQFIRGTREGAQEGLTEIYSPNETCQVIAQNEEWSTVSHRSAAAAASARWLTACPASKPPPGDPAKASQARQSTEVEDVRKRRKRGKKNRRSQQARHGDGCARSQRKTDDSAALRRLSFGSRSRSPSPSLLFSGEFWRRCMETARTSRRGGERGGGFSGEQSRVTAKNPPHPAGAGCWRRRISSPAPCEAYSSSLSPRRRNDARKSMENERARSTRLPRSLAREAADS
ncbi:hypothetical protein HPB50_024470 [Hyalomma asiaticum]|uniref:Uncharacterized protein n=1 Tax=Hyalomma asiaticum TaxID=266040 RepID=A0ACB7S9Q9_HYAAI|nr:hypothetical protein HPB50_024470 [Hyalomma asiaticum]